jgi:hypothetical protein
MKRIRKWFQLDVCLIIGEPSAGFIAEHHPAKSRWISQAEALGLRKLRAALRVGGDHPPARPGKRRPAGPGFADAPAGRRAAEP